MGVLARRSDLVFLRMLFRKFFNELSVQQKSNCRKVESFAWLRDDMQLLRNLSDDELRGAVHLIVASGTNRLHVFDVLRLVVRHGGPLARRTAVELLATFKGGAANELVLSAADDLDPEVQAKAVRQLRERGIPGVMSRLVELLDSPHKIVREAVHESLSEFNFQRFLNAFDMLEPEVQRCSGALVMRVDSTAVEQLNSELLSASHSRRLRGIRIAIAMGAVRQVEASMLQIAQDNDHFVRVEAARALIYSDSEKTRKVLDELLNDRSVSVQEAARETLAILQANARLGTRSSPAIASQFEPLVFTDLPPMEASR
jgi:HEAT repeat protein